MRIAKGLPCTWVLAWRPGEEKRALAFRELLMKTVEHGGKFDPG
jgi:hypothetical protein